MSGSSGEKDSKGLGAVGEKTKAARRRIGGSRRNENRRLRRSGCTRWRHEAGDITIAEDGSCCRCYRRQQHKNLEVISTGKQRCKLLILLGLFKKFRVIILKIFEIKIFPGIEHAARYPPAPRRRPHQMLRSHSLLAHFVPFASSFHRLSLPPLFLLHGTASSGSSFPRASRGRPVPVAALRPLLADLPETDGSPEDARGIEDGPVELPSSTGSSIFAVDDNPTPLQVSTSVLLTGAISVFLFRSLRRRAKRAKELRLRSSGVEKPKTLKAEALESLKVIGASPLEAGKPPSPLQALLGGIAAGVIALILYKFTATIEAALNRQAISDNFSVRQITITIRTIVNGLCYLATFVFGANSVGLILYAGQLALGSFGESSNTPITVKDDTQPSEIAPAEGTANALESRTDEVPQNSDGTKSS